MADNIEILFEYNALLDRDEAKKRNQVIRKDYKIFIDEIKKPLAKLNKENPELYLTYLYNSNTNEFSIHRSTPMDDKSKETVVEFLVYLNRMASEHLK